MSTANRSRRDFQGLATSHKRHKPKSVEVEALFGKGVQTKYLVNFAELPR
jgi:hypothetical protein